MLNCLFLHQALSVFVKQCYRRQKAAAAPISEIGVTVTDAREAFLSIIYHFLVRREAVTGDGDFLARFGALVKCKILGMDAATQRRQCLSRSFGKNGNPIAAMHFLVHSIFNEDECAFVSRNLRGGGIDVTNDSTTASFGWRLSSFAPAAAAVKIVVFTHIHGNVPLLFRKNGIFFELASAVLRVRNYNRGHVTTGINCGGGGQYLYDSKDAAVLVSDWNKEDEARTVLERRYPNTRWSGYSLVVYARVSRAYVSQKYAVGTVAVLEREDGSLVWTADAGTLNTTIDEDGVGPPPKSSGGGYCSVM